jgi:transposase
VDRAVAAARARWRLPTSASVVSCYEAGRNGFWVHRALTARGFRNRVVDSASIEVNRRAKRAKTDRLDAVKLVTMLLSFDQATVPSKRGWWALPPPAFARPSNLAMFD